jgi:hypothetical protein
MGRQAVRFLSETSDGKTFTSRTRTVLSDNFLERMAAGRGRVTITTSGAGDLAREDKKLDVGHGTRDGRGLSRAWPDHAQMI